MADVAALYLADQDHWYGYLLPGRWDAHERAMLQAAKNEGHRDVLFARNQRLHVDLALGKAHCEIGVEKGHCGLMAVKGLFLRQVADDDVAGK